MIELNEEQRRQLENGQAVEVADPRTAEPYVLLRKDVYERARHLLDDGSEWTADDLRLLLAHSAQDNGWNEAGMGVHDCYDEKPRESRMAPHWLQCFISSRLLIPWGKALPT